jgi:hypothetical protein
VVDEVDAIGMSSIGLDMVVGMVCVVEQVEPTLRAPRPVRFVSVCRSTIANDFVQKH